MPGTKVIQVIMDATIPNGLTEEQASYLWGEVRTRMESLKQDSSIKEAEAPIKGPLELRYIGDILDALANVVAKCESWPSKKDPSFPEAMMVAFVERGYLTADMKSHFEKQGYRKDQLSLAS